MTAQAPAADAVVPRAGTLWRDRNFRSYLIGQGVTVTGSSVTTVAIPVLAALELHASTLQVSCLAVAGRLPPLLFTLPAGVLADRVAKKPLVIGCELASGVVLATLPLVSIVRTPPLLQLYAVTFLVAAFQVVGGIASVSYVPCLVGRARLVEANSRIGSVSSLADLIGSNTGGALVVLLSAARAVSLDSVSYFLSALLLLRVRGPEPAPPRDAAASMLTEIREGLRYTLRTPLVRSFVLSNTATASAMAASSAIWSLYLLRNLHFSAQVFGLVMGAGGLGGVVGGYSGRRLAARFGTARVILTALALFPLAQLPLLLVGPGLVGQWAIGAGMVVQVGCAVASGGLIRSVRQILAPPELQGRAQSTGSWLAFGLRPVASLAAGVLATAVGLRPTLVVTTAFLILPFWILWHSPVRHLRDLPGHPSPAAPDPDPWPGATARAGLPTQATPPQDPQPGQHLTGGRPTGPPPPDLSARRIDPAIVATTTEESE
ncbi:MFS transporter [Streptacidiphilus sp. EB103A]|uniref:MFS transporter n=1 Tax=Streptacidiphilus sp. EB103A TaxID=3156275 RepID=UPI0035158E71